MKIKSMLKKYRELPKESRLIYAKKILDYLLGRLSGSQFGEDLSVLEYFLTIGKPVITYLDIGANHPKLHSNTYLFYRNGSSGVLVDANSKICKKLQKSRAQDKTINVGIASTGRGIMDLTVMDIDGLSTLNPEWKEHILAQGITSETGTQSVKIIGINSLLEEHFPQLPPDYVSIDIEGMDFEVLKAWDFTRWRPRIICIETGVLTCGKYVRDERFKNLMDQRGYHAIFQTFSNTIFLNNKNP